MTPVVEKLSAEVDDWVAKNNAQLISTRRHIHAHPELAFAEFETTSYLEQRLREVGLKPRRLPTGTGLVVDVGSGGAGGEPIVVLRADIDALPIADLKDVPYASTKEGLAHACGHDVHTTVVLGVAQALAGVEGLPGRVRCIFQPAEEDGRVDVVPAGVAQALAGGGVRNVLEVGQGERVDVRPEDDDRVTRADLADEPGAGRQAPRREAVGAQPLLEERSGLELREGELGVSVQMPTGRDQLRVVRGDPVVDGGADLLDDRGHAACPPAELGAGAMSGPPSPSRISVSRLSTTALRSPPFAAATAR